MTINNDAARTEGTEPDVLGVEDDPEINALVGAYVQIAGLHYRGVGSGGAAFEAVSQRKPALVILDVMLPDLDGFEICRRLKNDPLTRSIPVVMLTALDQPAQRQMGRHCGAVEYLTKPFDPDRLLSIIRSHAHDSRPMEATANH